MGRATTERRARAVATLAAVVTLAATFARARGETWLRAVTENGRVRAIERAEMGGSEWRKSWERDLSVTERHSFSAQQLGVLFAKQEEPTAVEYDEFMRSWVDAGVSSEFDRRELVEAEEEENSGERDEFSTEDGEEEEEKGSNRFFTRSITSASMQHILNKYGRTVESAMDVIKKRLQIDPNNPFLLNDLGLCHRILGENRKAAECFSRALRIVKHPDLYRLLGTSLMVTDRVDDALKTFNQGAVMFPDDPSILYSIALVHVQLENWRDAVAVLEKVTHHDPHFAGGMAHEHLLTATNNLRMQSSVRLEAGVFVMFIITIIMLAWMKCSRWQQRSRKSHHKKIKRK